MSNRLMFVNEAVFNLFGKFNRKLGWSRRNDSRVIENTEKRITVDHMAWINSNGEPVYDQILRAEAGGGVFLPYDERGRVGLIEVLRPQTPDPERWRKRFPSYNPEELGRQSLEIPRGMCESTDQDSHQTAVREAEEETGKVVTQIEKLGYITDNTTFSPHMTALTIGKVDMGRKSTAKPDPNEEFTKGLVFYTCSEVAQFVNKGNLYCGMTLAAIAKVILLRPGLLK